MHVVLFLLHGWAVERLLNLLPDTVETQIRILAQSVAQGFKFSKCQPGSRVKNSDSVVKRTGGQGERVDKQA